VTAPGNEDRELDDDGTIETDETVESGDEETVEDDAPAVRPDGQPFTAGDLRRLQETLKKARRDARSAKSGRQTTEATKTAAEEAAAEASRAAEAKFKPVVVRTAARAAFLEAGLVLPKGRSDAAFNRAVKLLDLDELEITDDGDVEGLAEQIDDLKAEFPELFVSTRRPGRIDGAGREGTDNSGQRSSAAKLAALLK
jgi:hypothetical protein